MKFDKMLTEKVSRKTMVIESESITKFTLPTQIKL
jgi:hypothetical protein